jgi:hypothetical protein
LRDFQIVVDAEVQLTKERNMKTLIDIKHMKRLGFLASILIALNLSTALTNAQSEPVGGGVSLRVVGGTVANPSDYPWMVGLVSGDESNLSNAQFWVV